MRTLKHIAAVIAAGAAFALVLAGTVPAFAAWGDNTYVVWDDVSALHPAGESPHGNYTTTSRKCGVCHSVHSADPTGELLLRGSVDTACTYCHVTGGVSSLTVYNGVYANYAGTDFENAHNNSASYSTLKCTTCHQVHAAADKMTVNTSLTDKILAGSKLDSGYDPNAGAPKTTDNKPLALSKWCTRCHFLGGRSYFATGYAVGLTTHVMKTPTSDYSSEQLASTLATQVAYQSSEYCSSCHVSNYGDGSGAWPHYTAGARFLVSADDSSMAGLAPVPTGGAKLDGVCLRCHRSGDGRGVGVSW